MDTLKVSTRNPDDLIREIIERIDTNTIRTWIYNEENDVFSHRGAQYRDHFYFEYKVNDDKGIVIFTLQSDGHHFAESRAFQLSERMLLAHFSARIEIIRN